MAIGLSICTDVMNLGKDERNKYLADILPEVDFVEIQLSQFLLRQRQQAIQFTIDVIKRYGLSWTAHFPKEDRGMTFLMRKDLFNKQARFWLNETLPFIRLIGYASKVLCLGVILHLDALRIRYRNLMSLDEIIENFQRFCSLAAQFKIPILIENLDDFDYPRLKEIIRNGDWKLCRDLGHEAFDGRTMPKDLWERVGLMHIHGFDGRKDHLPLDASRDAKILNQLSKQLALDPDLPIILEIKYFPVDKIRQSIEIIKETREKCLSSRSSEREVSLL